MKKIIALTLVLTLVLSVMSGCAKSGKSAAAPNASTASNPKTPVTAQGNCVAQANYPQQLQFPKEDDFKDGLYSEEYNAAYTAWFNQISAQRSHQYEHPNYFLQRTAPAFLSELGTKNGVYSPLNVFLALAMLAEITDGQSRQQVLDLLGYADLPSLRQAVGSLWLANYSDDGSVTSILGSSLWLNKDLPCVQKTLDTLATNYYASAFSGEMGSPQYTQLLRDWLNEQTGGLLQEQAGNIELTPETVLAIATTVYFKAGWQDSFSPDATVQQVFHATDKDITCDFMNMSDSMQYYWGENFSATSLLFQNGGDMWFFLPDENVSTDALLAENSGIYSLLSDAYAWQNAKNIEVNLSVPKFDVSSQMDLCTQLQTLGVTDVFSWKSSDFTPLTTATDKIFVSQVNHAARVKIDEEGCEAAAFTVMIMEATCAPPTDEVDFVLDRPFVFAVTGVNGDVLFIGVVNQPVE